MPGAIVLHQKSHLLKDLAVAKYVVLIPVLPNASPNAGIGLDPVLLLKTNIIFN